MIVYLPATPAEAAGLRAGGDLPARRGYAVTPSLLEAAGFSAKEAEDAGYTALCHAGVQALLDPAAGAEPPERRLIIAAEPDSIKDLTDPQGAVEVTGLRWQDVLALYYDEPEAAAAVRKAAAAVSPGEPVADALARSEVDALLHDHDLLWYDPTELDRLDQPSA
ncbi:DUF6912 family protein [Microlunatus speluncae]|uniref:DUF6912 family protein n=1 Tax=Microlunatus speluncae TaxID=2594267 RepID=UPI0012662E9F|nr:hypothetical protein [Microlunatus speluncae]